MSEQLKIAQMNTKAVLAKLAEYEQRHVEQEARVTTAEAKVAELQRQLADLQQMVAGMLTAERR